MNRTIYIIPVAVLGLFLCATTKAKEKEVQFTTVPEVVRTTVFHKYHITSPEKVVRVVEEPDNIYELTILTDSGQQIVFVNVDGTIVERPGGVVETTKGESESAEVTVTLDEIQGASERYEFVQDQGPDAIYIDHQTNKRVIVKGGGGHRGGVRTKEGSQTDVRTNERTNEKSQTDVRTNEENKGGVRTEERDQQSGNMREKTDQGKVDQGQKDMRNEQRNADQDQKNMKEGEKTQNRSTQGEQREQGNRESTAPGNGRQEDKNASQRNMNGEQQGQKQQRETTRTPGEKQSQENSKGKGKASPTP
jgi:hypothetical protein